MPYRLAFAAPAYLAILALLPALVWIGYRRLAALGRVRRWIVLGCRVLLASLFIFALAEVQVVRTSDRLTVVYLLDQSLSIPADRRRAMIEYVNADIHRQRRDRDRAGVVVFGRDAAVEVPPFDGDVRLAKTVESAVDPEATNLASAMKLAQALFPEDAAKRVVLVSDGCQNVGDAAEQASALAAAGIGLDVVAIDYPIRNDVLVERVSTPPDVRRNEPFDVRIVLTNAATATADRSGEVRGRLVLSSTSDGRTEVLSDEPVSLPPGKKVFSIWQKIDSPGFYAYEARFLPAREADDAIPQNNRAAAFTHVQGKGRALLVENHEHPGEFAILADRLRRQGLEIDVQTSNRTFSTLAELQPYDTVLLADVPREQFDEEQIAMLARNTQQMGAGLVMLGGPNSFGAGGWANTEVERAMPVDFQIKNAKVAPVGALMLVIDNSGSMVGQKVEMCKAAAVAGVKMLGPRDYVGVVTFDTNAQLIVPMSRAGSLQAILRRIERIGAGGGTNMEPGIAMGRQNLKKAGASIKHMVVLTDGQTVGDGYERLASQMHKEGITISTVAVGPDANVPLLGRMAQFGGGKLYRVRNPKTLPRIFMQEARRVSRPLIWDKRPFEPRLRMPSHEILRGIDGPLPPVFGYVMTSRKEGGPLVETLMISPEPADEENASLLACWTYGLGRTAVFTSDAGARWMTAWVKEPVYDRLFGQLVRWSMRPAGGAGKFTLATEPADGEIRVVVNALDKDDAFLNFLNMAATVLGPDMKPVAWKILQTSPGRYVGAFPARQAGDYFLTINPGAGYAPIRAGVTVPDAEEFRDRRPNDALLGRLAAVTPKGGSPGKIAELPPDESLETSPKSTAFADPASHFRHDLLKAVAGQDVWHELLFLACCLLFGDVLFRRVHIHFGWALTLAAHARDWALRRRRPAAAPEFLERLRSRKEEVAERLDHLRTAARFEPPPNVGANPPRPETPPSRDAEKPDVAAAPSKPPTSEESYTERLLRAKKKIWEDGR